MTAAGRCWTVAAAVLAGGLATRGAARGDDACSRPESERAPDLRCGESLDGRAPPEPPASLTAARVALAGPRLAATAVLWPVVKTTDVVEHYRLLDWMQAVLTTDD